MTNDITLSFDTEAAKLTHARICVAYWLSEGAPGIAKELTRQFCRHEWLTEAQQAELKAFYDEQLGANVTAGLPLFEFGEGERP